MKFDHPAHMYAENVLGGQVCSCRWVRLACERYIHDLDHGQERGIVFDRAAAERVINFYQFCPHFRGEWAGQPIDPAPWQNFVAWNLFGWKWRATGYRRFKVAYITVARKNGKTTWLAPIGIYGLVADDEPGAEIYSVAYDKKQAREVFDASRAMVVSGPLAGYVNALTYNMSVDATASKYEPLTADDKAHHGKNIHFAMCDELHVWPKPALWWVLRTGMGARRQPLQAAITTAGSDRQSICYQQHEYAQKVLQGFKSSAFVDDTFFGIIYTLDRKADWPDLQTKQEHEKDAAGTQEDDWTDERCWLKANPNLGVSPKLQDLRDEARTAIQMPAAQNDFLRLRMNVWTQQVDRWISMDLWDANATRGVYVTATD